MKISGIDQIPPDLKKVAGLTSGGLSNMGLFSPAGIKQINLILTNIREMVKEAKELQNPTKEAVTPNTAIQPSGLTKEQLYGLGKNFLDNLIKGGYGDKTLSETISDIPLSIKQLRGLLKWKAPDLHGVEILCGRLEWGIGITELEGLIRYWQSILNDTEFLLSPSVRAAIVGTIKHLRSIKEC